MGLFEENDLARTGQAAPIVLRDYQEKARAAVLGAKDRGLSRVMIVQPTGTGKTTVFASLVDAFERSYAAPALVLAHRQELLVQAADRIASMVPRLEVGIEGGDQSAGFEARAIVAGVQSIGRPGSKRLDWYSPGLLVIDEGHHAPADSYQNVMRRFGAYDGRIFTVAVTATDHRMDNRPLHGQGGAIFEDVVFRYSLRQAVADGWLVDLRGYRVATGVDISGVKTQLGDYNLSQLAKAVNTEERNLVAYQHWREVAGDRRTIVFCVDVQHAKDVAQLFRDWDVNAEHVDGTMPSHQRDGILRRWRLGKSQVLVNVDICTEGFDAPECDCVVMLRPTQSWALYTQMAGRGVRTLPRTVDGLDGPTERRRAIRDCAKPDCIVIDVVDVSKQFSLVAPPEEGVEPEKVVPQKPTHASLAGMMGLPPELDLEGHSLFQAAEAFEELPPVRRSEMFRRQTTFEDLSTVLSEVDLLKELSIPEEIVGVTQLAWLKVGESTYHLPCGSSPSERDRVARIEGDELGRYRLILRSASMEYPPVPLGEEIERAFDEADRTIHSWWPDAGRIVRGDAGWRSQAPSPKQLELLRSMGVGEDELGFVTTRGQARALIEQRRLGNVRRRRL